MHPPAGVASRIFLWSCAVLAWCALVAEFASGVTGTQLTAGIVRMLSVSFGHASTALGR